jgi:SAM-dependent methyltransferase
MGEFDRPPASNEETATMRTLLEATDALETDHKDSVLYMVLRRVINGEYAEHPVDFNIAGIEAGEQSLGRRLDDNDVIVDIGSSTGEMIANAAQALETPAKIVAVEPARDAAALHRLLPKDMQSGMTYIRGKGEAIPLADNSATGATLHNVIFRADDAQAVLNEVKRIVRPGGFIAISSNAKEHARYRHAFEQAVAERVMRVSGVQFIPPKPPAEGFYLSDLPRLVAIVGDLVVVPDLYVNQNTRAIITRGERLTHYLQSIDFSAATTNIPPELRSVWRRMVHEVVEPYIDHTITTMEHCAKRNGIAQEPFFADTIQRGMFVLRNAKTSL